MEGAENKEVEKSASQEKTTSLEAAESGADNPAVAPRTSVENRVSTSEKEKRRRSTKKDAPKSAGVDPRRSSSNKENVKKKKSKLPSDDRLSVMSATTAGDQGLPKGVIPIFLAVTTQELFGLRTNEDVTAADPYKLIKKEDIVKDLFNRAAVSDFHPIKQLIVDYPGEDLLIVYDPDFKHGQNFIIATNEEAKQALLKEAEEEELEEEEELTQVYIPPVAKDWASLGSEMEVDEERVVEGRNKISVLIVRQRKDFGGPYSFSDRNAASVKEAYTECAPYEDKSFDLKKMELDVAVQAVDIQAEKASQTDWQYPKNASCQYEPREFTEEEKLAAESAPEFVEFVKLMTPRLELALQQNEIMDVFCDDWMSLTEEDGGTFGTKADNHLKEFQSFTDLQFSKTRTITCIDWHPTIKGVVAVSVGERMSFDERVDNMHKIILTPSLILIWSFTDPIHPQMLLEAPDDILSFKFCPTEPNYIAGGCINGQVVMWDISEHSDRLRQVRTGKSKEALNLLSGFEDDSSLSAPIVRYCAVSSIDHSHSEPITDLIWIPDHFELNRMGHPLENKSGQCCQIMTCATDHVVLVWDIRNTGSKTADKSKAEEKKAVLGIPTTFQHLDLVWKPYIKVAVVRFDAGGDFAPTKFSIFDRQGDKIQWGQDEDATKSGKTSDVSGAAGKTSVSQGKRLAKSISTLFYVGTEDGELTYLDWVPQKEQETGKMITPKPQYSHSIHNGPIVSLQRSPFFRDVLLCVGGWTFSIWKESVTSGPLLSSAVQSKRLTDGFWSPSRPAVFYITKLDGSIDIWDLLDRTHEPCMNQSVSTAPITCIYPFQVSSKQHLLGVGDANGTLHILAIPWSLRQPTLNEFTGMVNYIEREVKRQAFVSARWEFREKEKAEVEAENKKRAGIAPQVVLTDAEVEIRMRQEYEEYLVEEAAFLRQLGLVTDAPEAEKGAEKGAEETK